MFDLPEELIYTLELKPELNAGLNNLSVEDPESTTHGRRSTAESAEGAEKSSATSCALCNLNFPTLLEQRSHVRSDLHGYNLKQKMRGLKPVDEKDFERLVGDLDESLSGSDDSADTSSDDEDEEGGGKKKGDTTLSALLRKQANIADPDYENEQSGNRRKKGSGKPPLLWFSSAKLPKNTSLGVYRAIFTPVEQLLDSRGLVEVLQKKQLSSPSAQKPAITSTGTPLEPPSEQDGGVPLPKAQPKPPTVTGPHYFLSMIGGGHFAAMIISLVPKVSRRNGIEERSATVIAQKTFHRYTTRRKQGGSQSANDNSKGNAHSAGASIRRYNETALVADVRGLLSEWKSWIDSAELLFIRATGSTNRKTLFENYEGRVLDAKDERIRGFPFSTRRATTKELIRSFTELTRVKTSVIDEEAIKRKAAEEQAARDKVLAEEAKREERERERREKQKVLSQAEEEAMLHTQQVQSLIRRSKAPALLSYLNTNSLPPDYEFYPQDDPKNHHAPRPLHLAASLNSAVCISALLVKAGADPTIKSGEGKSAFELAGDRATRDAFRLARSELGEDKWPWDAAGVPPALSKSEADARASREREEQAAENASEAERRKHETERLRAEDKQQEEASKEKKYGKGKSLGILAEVEKQKTAQEKREDEARGMTPEMRMKLERERRARAAEARFAKK